MRYFVVTDVHAFTSELIKALTEAGFFTCTEEHRLILIGDCLDRGKEAEKMQAFLLSLMEEGRLILIKGNHEDLFLDMLEDYYEIRFDIMYGMSHHARNGTFDTALQLTGFSKKDALSMTGAFLYAAKHTPFVKTIIPHAIDYFETPHYIFTHGFLPSEETYGRYKLLENWREADEAAWRRARWINGMKAVCEHGNRVAGKTVVTGHFHTSYGHAVIHKNGSEFGSNAIFGPFYADGIIALDGCTAHSGKVNCIVIDD